jgi:hypothetical protein
MKKGKLPRKPVSMFTGKAAEGQRGLFHDQVHEPV